MDTATEHFEKHRSRLFRLAYGMLGRVAPAEDAVQETYLRWQKQEFDQVRSPGAYLSTLVSRICLDELKSARNRREEYVGPDLPEPLVHNDRDNPRKQTELAESLSMALLVVLKKLTPVQRAVFLLHEVFDYGYADIAEIVDKSEAHCRKIAQRARNHIQENRPRFNVEPEQQRRLISSFMEAVEHGNIDTLKEMLAEEAILYSDGGGKVSAARKPIYGAEKIARFMVGIQKNTSEEKVHINFTDVNGRPGMIAYINEQLHSVWSFQIKDEQIENIFIVLNPEKLEHLQQTGGRL